VSVSLAHQLTTLTPYGYFLLGSDHTRISGPVTATPRLPLHHTPTPHASRHGLGHGRTHGTTLGHGPVRLRPTRTTDRLTSPAWSRLLTPTGSLYGPGLDGSRPQQGRRPPHRPNPKGWSRHGTKLGSGRLGLPQDVPVTSHATLTDLVTVMTRITPYHVPATLGPAKFHPARTPSLPVVKMVNRDPGFSQVTYDKSYDAPLRHHHKKLDALWKAQGVSHTPWRPLSASRTHPTASTNHRNCRPGWRTCWVQIPPAAHCPAHALTRSKHHSGSHQEGASSISRGGALARCRGFGTCGWKGVGTPQTPKAGSRRCRAGTGPRSTR